MKLIYWIIKPISVGGMTESPPTAWKNKQTLCTSWGNIPHAHVIWSNFDRALNLNTYFVVEQFIEWKKLIPMPITPPVLFIDTLTTFIALVVRKIIYFNLLSSYTGEIVNWKSIQ